MQVEIEAKFLNQNHDVIRELLRQIGANRIYPKMTMRRTVLDYSDRRLQKKGAWVRLREELDGSIELMVKQVANDSLGQTFEQPITVSDYQAAKQFLLSLGLKVKGEQESKREVWEYKGIEIMLDEWPWVQPFIEIEAKTEAEVKDFAKLLGLNWSDAKFGGVTPVYLEEYTLTKEAFESLELSMKFDSPVPKVLAKYKKH